MLYLVATPIGNLSDMTYRAVDTLKSVDYILCEDTRHSLPLLKHFGIQKPLRSFHKFNECAKEDVLIQDLKEGKLIALISDAGTPAISDPGERLVKRCHNEGLKVTSIPGACAAIAAISASGLNTSHFQFCGFLPKKTKELKTLLQQILQNSATSICYESPKRLMNVLEEIHLLAPTRILTVARELTKKFEEIKRGTALELIKHFERPEIKGEIVLLVEGKEPSLETNFDTLSPKEHVQLLQDTYNLSKNEAIKMAASLRGVPKRTIYNETIKAT